MTTTTVPTVKLAYSVKEAAEATSLLRVTFRLNPEKPVDLRAFTAIRGDDTPTSDYVPTRDVAANLVAYIDNLPEG